MARIHQVEALIAHLAGREGALLTGRAAAGLSALLHVLGLQGQTIAIPASTCYIVAWAILDAGCTPQLVDYADESGQLVQPAQRAAAAIPAHFYGAPTPLEPAGGSWTADTLLFEDAALAAGNDLEGRPCGSRGLAALLSFGLGKPIDVEVGGAVVSDDAALLAECRRFLASAPIWSVEHHRRHAEWAELYWMLHRAEDSPTGLSALYPDLFERFRSLISFRLPEHYWSDLPLAVQQLADSRARRIERADLWREALDSTEAQPLPLDPNSALWRLPVRVPASQREDALRMLWSAGVLEAAAWYPSLQIMLRALRPDVPQPPTPRADALAREVIALPLDAAVTRRSVDQTAKALRALLC